MTVDLTPFRSAAAAFAPLKDDHQAARRQWLDTARPEQLPPDHGNWAIIAGRGFGKTRSGAEQVADDLLHQPRCRVAVIAPTNDDGRDVCIEGESGLLAVLARYGIRPGHGCRWNRSLGELVLDIGSRADLYTSEKPDALRGPQHHIAWCEETGAWIRASDTWDMMEFGLRLGDAPRWYVTTTPRPTPVIRAALSAATKVSRGSTYANAANLPKVFLDRLRAKYEGTRLGRQELHAELLEDVPGALWQRAQIELDRVSEVAYPHTLRYAYVGVDPSDATGEGDEMGLAVTGLGWDHDLYVVESRGCADGVTDALRQAVELAVRWSATIILEKNHGGAFLEATLKQVLRDLDVVVGYKLVSAADGKRTRAEPVAALYEQHRVHHVGSFPELEDQMCSWAGGGSSPDRLDALVWSVAPMLGHTLSAPGPAPAARGWTDRPATPAGTAVGWS